jgi:hypothetical protein
MTSAKQTKANQKNAAKSTGPTSKQGKEIVARNALKHGLTSQDQHLLPGENAQEFSTLQQLLRNDLRPIGMLENVLADLIINLVWRLRRTTGIETGVLAYAFYNSRCQQAAGRVQCLKDRALVFFEPSEKVKMAEQELVAATAERDEQVPWLGQAFIEDSEGRNALARLTRYETALLNQLTKANRELIALQEKRIESEKELDLDRLDRR